MPCFPLSFSKPKPTYIDDSGTEFQISPAKKQETLIQQLGKRIYHVLIFVGQDPVKTIEMCNNKFNTNFIIESHSIDNPLREKSNNKLHALCSMFEERLRNSEPNPSFFTFFTEDTDQKTKAYMQKLKDTLCGTENFSKESLDDIPLEAIAQFLLEMLAVNPRLKPGGLQIKGQYSQYIKTCKYKKALPHVFSIDPELRRILWAMSQYCEKISSDAERPGLDLIYPRRRLRLIYAFTEPLMMKIQKGLMPLRENDRRYTRTQEKAIRKAMEEDGGETAVEVLLDIASKWKSYGDFERGIRHPIVSKLIQARNLEVNRESTFEKNSSAEKKIHRALLQSVPNKTVREKPQKALEPKEFTALRNRKTYGKKFQKHEIKFNCLTTDELSDSDGFENNTFNVIYMTDQWRHKHRMHEQYAIHAQGTNKDESFWYGTANSIASLQQKISSYIRYIEVTSKLAQSNMSPEDSAALKRATHDLTHSGFRRQITF